MGPQCSRVAGPVRSATHLPQHVAAEWYCRPLRGRLNRNWRPQRRERSESWRDSRTSPNQQRMRRRAMFLPSVMALSPIWVMPFGTRPPPTAVARGSPLSCDKTSAAAKLARLRAAAMVRARGDSSTMSHARRCQPHVNIVRDMLLQLNDAGPFFVSYTPVGQNRGLVQPRPSRPWRAVTRRQPRVARGGQAGGGRAFTLATRDLAQVLLSLPDPA